jgi:hypothetical protein
MNDERHCPCAQLLDKKMAEKVVVSGEVVDIHDLGGPP